MSRKSVNAGLWLLLEGGRPVEAVAGVGWRHNADGQIEVSGGRSWHGVAIAWCRPGDKAWRPIEELAATKGAKAG